MLSRQQLFCTSKMVCGQHSRGLPHFSIPFIMQNCLPETPIMIRKQLIMGERMNFYKRTKEQEVHTVTVVLSQVAVPFVRNVINVLLPHSLFCPRLQNWQFTNCKLVAS